MGKYVYVSILLGAFALLGCTDDELNTKNVTTESLPAEESIKNKNEVNTTKIVEVEPIPLTLTQDQKEEYYKKYVDIIEKINVKNKEEFKLELEPITSFLDEHWLEVEAFEKLANERSNASIIVLENNQQYNPMSVPKTVKLQIGSKQTNIIFEGSFETQLNINQPDGRQLFSAFNSISSKSVDGSWTQLGYNAVLINNQTTYVIEVGGKYSQSGLISTHTMSLEFNCNKNGGIS